LNASVLAAVFAGLSFLATLVGVIFIGGKLSQRVEDHGLRLNGHDRLFERHDVRLGSNEIAIEGLKQWRDGYNAATATPGKS
jgi:hypothetical protein